MPIFPTKMIDAIILAGDQYKLQAYEGRLSNYDVFKAFVDNTSELIPASQIESAKTSHSRPTKIPVLKKQAVTIGDTRKCTPSGFDIDTAFVQPTFATYTFDIKMTPAENADNYFDYQADFAHKLTQALKAFGEKIDTDARLFLDSKVSLVNASPLFGALTAGKKTVPYEEREEFYKSIPAIMRRNDLSGNMVLDIANPEAQIMYDSIARQGAGNDVNTAYQISNFAPYRSNSINPATGASELHYLLPKGSIGMLSWIPWEYKTGVGTGDSVWGSVVDPIFGLTWGLRYTYGCVDNSAVVGGYPQNRTNFVEQFEFSIDIAFMSAYSSDTSSQIFKYEIAEKP